MRRVIAPIAAALLALTFAGPVAADPTAQQSRWTDVYQITCGDGTEIPDLFAHGVPGWDVEWAPGGTPWLLMGYNVTIDDVVYVVPLKGAGLDRNEKLVGPCTITTDGLAGAITDAYFLKR